MTTSSLDGIPGLGEARKKKLDPAMGGVNAVKRAQPRQTLRALSFLPDAVAVAMFERFQPDRDRCAVGTEVDPRNPVVGDAKAGSAVGGQRRRRVRRRLRPVTVRSCHRRETSPGTMNSSKP